MNLLLASLTVLGTSFYLAPPNFEPDKLLSEYEKKCTGAKRASDCDRLQLQVEQLLYQDLQTLLYVKKHYCYPRKI